MTHFEAKDYKTVLGGALNLPGSHSPSGLYRIDTKSRIECTVPFFFAPSPKYKHLPQKLLNHPDDKFPTKMKKNFVSKTGAEVHIDKVQAMNDITLDRGPSQSLTNIECYINGKLLTTIQADGYHPFFGPTVVTTTKNK